MVIKGVESSFARTAGKITQSARIVEEAPKMMGGVSEVRRESSLQLIEMASHVCNILRFGEVYHMNTE